MIRTIALLATSLCFSLSVGAGDTKRNGGDVLVCKTAIGTSYELLDLREGQMAYGFYPFETLTLDRQKISEMILNLIGKFNPSRAELYSDYLRTWKQESRMVKASSFTNYSDEGGLLIPDGCKLEQAILQLRTPDRDGARYLVNENIWNHLAARDQAALIFHELIYREVTSSNPLIQDSSSVRYFTAALFSQEAQKSRLIDYIGFLQRSGLKVADAHGYKIALNSGDELGHWTQYYPVSFHDPDSISSATVGTRLIVESKYRREIACAPFQSGPQEMKIIFSRGSSEAIVMASCLLYLDLDQSGRRGGLFADYLQMRSANEISSARLLQWEKLKGVGGASLYLSDTQFSLTKSDEVTVSFWPEGDLQMIKKWQNETDLQSSFIQTQGQNQSLKDLKIDRLCFSERDQGLVRCGDLAWIGEL